MSSDINNLYVRSQQKLDAGDYESALDDLGEVIQLVPSEPEYYWTRARCWSQLSNPNAEFDDLAKILEVTDDLAWHAKAHRLRAIRLQQQKKWEGAIIEGEWLLNHGFEDDHIHKLIAGCKNELGQVEDAILHYTIAIELSPSPIPLISRAHIYIKLNKFSEAIQDLSEALEKCNDTYDVKFVVYRLRGETYYQLNDKVRALDDFNNYQLIRGIEKYSSADEYIQAFESWAKKANEYRIARDL